MGVRSTSNKPAIWESDAAVLIRTPRLLLTTPRPEDYRPVFEVSLEPEVFWRWNPSDQSGSYDRFVARLWDGILCHFVVRRRDHNVKTIGLVRLRDANFVHQTVQISGYMAGEAQGTGLGLEAFIFASSHEDMHAGELEVSILLTFCPEWVREGFQDGDHIANDRAQLLTKRMDFYTTSGIIGRPSLASDQKGERAVKALVESFGLVSICECS